MYNITPLKSKRDQIKRTAGQRSFDLPGPGSLILVGSVKSGKTTIIGNLLMKSTMLKGYFDKVYLFCLSPCTTLIDNVPELTDDYIFTDDNPEMLTKLYQQNKALTKDIGFKRTPNVLFILDDIIQSKKFMNSPTLGELFYSGSHCKCSIWILTQNYMSIPRRMRMTSIGMIICHGVNNTEKERFAIEYQSAYLDKKEFMEMIDHCLEKPFSFMFVNLDNSLRKYPLSALSSHDHWCT